MAEKEIKSKIVLDGEKEYSSTIKSASRNLKTLKSELQAETKELGNNATAQQKAEVKAKSLKQQIAEQEKVVQACRAALEEVKEKYGDNEDAVAKYEQKLNNARSALADMNNQLQDVSGSLEQNATDLTAVKTAANTGVTATESFANALEKVSSVGETVSSAIEGIFTGMVSAVQDAVAELWGLISATAAKADDWSDTAGYWNTDAQTIQQYARAVSAANDSFDDLNSAVSRIVLGGKGKQITEMLNISDNNYTDQWKYAMDVMTALYQKAAEGEDITPILETLFGEKKSVKIMDLVNDWNSIQSKLAEFNGDETGYGMTSEGLKTMQQVQLNIADIEARFDALKDRFAQGFGTTVLTLQTHVIGGLDALADFMNAESDEERQAALDKLTEEVEGFAEDVAAAIEAAVATLSQIGSSLKDSDNPYVSAVGKLFEGVADTMQWIIDNSDKVATALRAIFDTWLLGQVTSLAGKLAAMVTNFLLIKNFLGSGGGTATTTAAAAEGAKNLLGSLGVGLTNLGGKIGTAVSGFGTFGLNNLGVVGDWFSNNTRFGRALTRGEEGIGEALVGTVEEFAENVEKNASTFTDDWAGLGVQVLEALTGEEYGGGAEHEFELPEPEKEPEPEATKEDNKNALLMDADQVTTVVDAIMAEVQKAMEHQGDGSLYELFSPTYGSGLSEEQIDAAESYWDFLRNWGLTGEGDFDSAYDAFEAAFGSDSALFDTVDEMMEQLAQKYDLWSDMPEDLPGSWWETLTGSEALKKSDVDAFKNVPDNMATAVEGAVLSGMSGIKVEMDGQVVGTLIAPYVNQQLALSMFR